MADDDQLTAILAGIRDEAQSSIAYADNHACPDITNSCSEHNALRLLAAVDAVLKLPVEWRRESEALRDAAGKVWEDTPDAPGVRLKHAYAAGYAECAKALEAVITRELREHDHG